MSGSAQIGPLLAGPLLAIPPITAVILRLRSLILGVLVDAQARLCSLPRREGHVLALGSFTVWSATSGAYSVTSSTMPGVIR